MSNQQVAKQNQNRQQVARAWTQEEFQSTLDSRMPVLTPLLPAHIAPDRFRSMIVTEVAFNDKLWVCSLKSIIQSVRDAADLGLSLNKQMKEGDILPVWSPRGTEAQFRPRAIGLVKLARQSGEVLDMWAAVVYENDKFSYTLGLHKDLIHEPAPDSQRGEMLQQAYCCWKAKDGSLGFEVIGAKRIARAKSSSEGYKAFKAEKIKSTPWVEDEEEMIKKTAIIAGSKYMPKSAESDKFARAVALAHDSEFDDADEHVGVPSEPRVIPPRPTRQDVRAEQEQVRKAEAEAKKQYRDTMREEPRPTPAHDVTTGEVTDEGATDAAQEPERDANGQDTGAQGPAAQAPTPQVSGVGGQGREAVNYDDIAGTVITKIRGASTRKNLENIIGAVYAQDIETLRVESPDLNSRVQAAIQERRKYFAG